MTERAGDGQDNGQPGTPIQLTKKDFISDQEPRWCPGCGDYAILSTVQGFLPELGVPPHQMVWVAGIGCSGRFAYYVDTYGVRDPRAGPGPGHGDRHGPAGPVGMGGHR